MLNKAIKLAHFNLDWKFRLCAIVTDKKRNILSVGINSYNKTHPTQAYYAEKYGNKDRIFLHAEIDALTKIPYGKKPYAIYIARVNKQGKALLAKPCKICENAIKDVGIKRIIYTRD